MKARWRLLQAIGIVTFFSSFVVSYVVGDVAFPGTWISWAAATAIAGMVTALIGSVGALFANE